MNELGERVKEAEAVMAKAPKGSEAYEKAAKIHYALSHRGLASLDASDLTTLLSQAAIRQRVRETNGWAPGSSDAVESRLAGYAMGTPEQQSEGSHFFGQDSRVLRNGAKIRPVQLAYDQAANTIAPNLFGHIPSTQFDAGLYPSIRNK